MVPLSIWKLTRSTAGAPPNSRVRLFTSIIMGWKPSLECLMTWAGMVGPWRSRGLAVSESHITIMTKGRVCSRCRSAREKLSEFQTSVELNSPASRLGVILENRLRRDGLGLFRRTLDTPASSPLSRFACALTPTS